MSWVLTIAGFVLLIVLHEAGHFVAAKAVGMRVERFFLFFPPKLVSKRIGETEYGIGAIPLGGFVKITGMNPQELEAAEHGQPVGERGLLETIEGASPGPETPAGVESGVPLPPEVLERAYYNQPVWKRILVIAMGPAVNILIAFLLLFALSLTAQQAAGSGLKVSDVKSNSPAASILRKGDKIISVDGSTAANLSANDRAKRFAQTISSHACAGNPTDGCAATTPVHLLVERDGHPLSLTATPRYDATAQPARTRLGFGFAPTNLVSAHHSMDKAAGDALHEMWLVSSKTVSVFAQIFKASERKNLSGPVGTSDVLSQAIGYNARTALTFLAIISLSLGLINLFPFLPLDGGHIFWSLVEKFRRRPVSFETMERAGVLGFALVLMLFAIGLTNDIGKLSGPACKRPGAVAFDPNCR